MATKICAQCQKEIAEGEDYFMVGDNYLQVNYFENNELNVFCSESCLMESLSVICMTNEQEDEDGADE